MSNIDLLADRSELASDPVLFKCEELVKVYESWILQGRLKNLQSDVDSRKSLKEKEDVEFGHLGVSITDQAEQNIFDFLVRRSLSLRL